MSIYELNLAEKRFEIVCKMIRIKEGPAKKAAEHVMVWEMTPKEAAECAGCSQQSESATRHRILRAMEILEKY